MSILEGVRVIDFTQGFAGPFCTMQLADFGAEVIKIERPGCGDSSRFWGPFHDGQSAYFAMANRMKKSVAVDFQGDEGREALLRLIDSADILVESFKPGLMDKLGFGYEAIHARNPRLVYASISGYGQTGPWALRPAYDNVIQAASGVMDMTGFPEDPPVKAGVSIGDSVAALHCTLGLLTAYFYRLRRGIGQQVDVSMLDSLVSLTESPILFESLLGIEPSRCGNSDPATLVPYDVYACRDGYFSAGLAGDAGWDRFCEAMKREDLLEDPRYRDNAARCRNFATLDPELKAFFADKTRAELGKLLTTFGIPNAPVLSVGEIMDHPQSVDRDMVLSIKDDNIGRYEAIGTPMKMSRTPAVIDRGSPRLGADTQSVLETAGFSGEEIVRLL